MTINTPPTQNPPTILDLAAYLGINELQATAKVILGDTTDYNKVVALLAQIEMLIMTPGATEEIEEVMPR